jgi:hypothetical protein
MNKNSASQISNVWKLARDLAKTKILTQQVYDGAGNSMIQ